MVFGEPVYNSRYRREALAKFKRYIDKKRKKKRKSRAIKLKKQQQKKRLEISQNQWLVYQMKQ